MGNRKVCLDKLINGHSIGVILFIAFNYLTFVMGYMFELKPTLDIILLLVFHFLLLLLLWSMIKSILEDPGKVPIYWGFFAEESDNRRRRYCLVCHCFKPERQAQIVTQMSPLFNLQKMRCQYGSSQSVDSKLCGLNNRKFFMLFLFYIILMLVFAIFCETPLLVQQYFQKSSQQSIQAHTIFRALALLVQISFFCILTIFFKFHVQLVLSNSSIIDHMERKRNPNSGPNTFDVGPYKNFVQVFGTKPCLWPLPISSQSAQSGNKVAQKKNQ